MSENLQRLFVALELPMPTKFLLSSLQKSLQCTHLISPENMHLTLNFIGEVSLEKSKSIKLQLKTIQLERFSLQVSGINFFNKKTHAILWAKVEFSDYLESLKKDLDGVLSNCGVKGLREPFIAHITLGRQQPLDFKLLQRIIKHNSVSFPEFFMVESFTLFESVLIPSGVVYRVEERYPLHTKG